MFGTMVRRIKKIIKLLKLIYDRTIYYLVDYLIALFYKLIPEKKLIKTIIEGDNNKENYQKYLCLFAHFDKDNIIDEYVVHYIKNLFSLKIDIIFISNCKFLKDKEIEKIKPYCKKIIIRKGRARDFGSWKIGISVLGEDIKNYDYLILANDSVYGPLNNNLKNILSFFENSQYDGFGITDSYEVKYHLQSYFLIFKKNIITSKVFNNFWQNFYFFNRKRTIIEKYEIGLSQKLIKHGFKLGAYYDYWGLIKSINESHPYYSLIVNNFVNPTHFLWDKLIKKGCPFIKIELLRDNPSKISNVYQWEKILFDSINKSVIIEPLSNVYQLEKILFDPINKSAIIEPFQEMRNIIKNHLKRVCKGWK
jgi:rhamnosyltransferase